MIVGDVGEGAAVIFGDDELYYTLSSAESHSGLSVEGTRMLGYGICWRSWSIVEGAELSMEIRLKAVE